MQTIKRELTEEEYIMLTELPYAKREEYLFPDGIPQQWVAGYGYYGHHLRRNPAKNEYVVLFRLGDSCD